MVGRARAMAELISIGELIKNTDTHTHMYGLPPGGSEQIGEFEFNVIDGEDYATVDLVNLESEYKGKGLYVSLLNLARDYFKKELKLKGIKSEGKHRNHYADSAWNKLKDKRELDVTVDNKKYKDYTLEHLKNYEMFESAGSMLWYFAYGCNMDVERMRERFDVRQCIPGNLNGYKLLFDKDKKWANVEPDETSKVEGMLFLLKGDSPWNELDKQEGGYRRKDVVVHSEIGTVPAQTYVANKHSEYSASVDTKYMNKIIGTKQFFNQ